MSQPIETLLCTAATPAQAKVWVAMLQAEGIPARTDGDSLVDEFAASRRLMNLMGTKVIVPTGSVERAREIVQPAVVDAEELTRQALSESPESASPRDLGPVDDPSATMPPAMRAAALLGILGLIGALVWLAN